MRITLVTCMMVISLLNKGRGKTYLIETKDVTTDKRCRGPMQDLSRYRKKCLDRNQRKNPAKQRKKSDYEYGDWHLKRYGYDKHMKEYYNNENTKEHGSDLSQNQNSQYWPSNLRKTPTEQKKDYDYQYGDWYMKGSDKTENARSHRSDLSKNQKPKLLPGHVRKTFRK